MTIKHLLGWLLLSLPLVLLIIVNRDQIDWKILFGMLGGSTLIVGYLWLVIWLFAS